VICRRTRARHFSFKKLPSCVFFCRFWLPFHFRSPRTPRPNLRAQLRSKAAQESQALVQKLLREGKIMRSRDAKRGMRGVGYSVFQGTKIEKFNVEILGNLERVMGGGDLVMIRVLDGPVVQRNSGIIQGMSGSPVYINGKLLGAIAIGFGFPKEPIGGITPITQMIEATLPDNSKPPLPVKIAKSPVDESYQAKEPFRVANRLVSRVDVSLNPRKPAFSGSPLSSTMTMRPCTRLILLVWRFTAKSGALEPHVRAYGLTPMIGGSMMSSAQRAQVFGPSSQKSGVKANLAPGAAIGVQLASGDIDATGVGTVTYRLGNRVLAFGHPMFGLGSVSMPMTNGVCPRHFSVVSNFVQARFAHRKRGRIAARFGVRSGRNGRATRANHSSARSYHGSVEENQSPFQRAFDQRSALHAGTFDFDFD
jgi:hypothetical protein